MTQSQLRDARRDLTLDNSCFDTATDDYLLVNFAARVDNDIIEHSEIAREPVWPGVLGFHGIEEDSDRTIFHPTYRTNLDWNGVATIVSVRLWMPERKTVAQAEKFILVYLPR